VHWGGQSVKNADDANVLPAAGASLVTTLKDISQLTAF